MNLNAGQNVTSQYHYHLFIQWSNNGLKLTINSVQRTQKAVRILCIQYMYYFFIYTAALIKFFDAIFSKQNVQEYFMCIVAKI